MILVYRYILRINVLEFRDSGSTPTSRSTRDSIMRCEIIRTTYWTARQEECKEDTTNRQVKSYSASFFVLTFFFGRSFPSSLGSLAAFLTFFFFSPPSPSSAASLVFFLGFLAKSRSPLASLAVAAPPSLSVSDSDGEPASDSDAWKSSSVIAG